MMTRHDQIEMWLSVRKTRPLDVLPDEFRLPANGAKHVREIRTIDNFFNPCVEGNFIVHCLDDVWDILEEMLPVPDAATEYTLLFTDAHGPNSGLEHPRLKLLGYDLSDETWTSSLVNCGLWIGELEPIVQRCSENSLLSRRDAELAQRLLPELWKGDPHGLVTVWELYEISS